LSVIVYKCPIRSYGAAGEGQIAEICNAVVPDVVGVTLVSAAPAAVYPVPDTSLDVVYAVVPAPKDAELVYKANLNELPEVAVKLCVPTSNSCLKRRTHSG
jgi:hypothetical protein